MFYTSFFFLSFHKRHHFLSLIHLTPIEDLYEQSNTYNFVLDHFALVLLNEQLIFFPSAHYTFLCNILFSKLR